MLQTNLPDLIKAKYALQDDRKSPVLDAKQLIDLLLEAVVSTLALDGTNVDDAVKYTLSALYLLDELGSFSTPAQSDERSFVSSRNNCI